MKNEQPKVLNVLERMGMVRRSDEVDDPVEQKEEAATVVYEPEPTAFSKSFSDEGTQSTPAEERFWSEAEAAHEPKPEPRYATPAVSGDTPSAGDLDVSELAFKSEPEPEPIYKPVTFTPPPVSTSEERWGELKNEVGEKMNEASFWDDSPALNTDTDRFMEVEDIYRALNLKSGGTDTIYLVEEYMKTLPDSLPAESRRSIIMKIVGASGFDFDKLLNDGIDRVTKLNEYAATFAQQTDKIVARHNSELGALEKQIQRVRELIGERKNLHKRQFLSIENEAQRLKEVLDFVTK